MRHLRHRLAGALDLGGLALRRVQELRAHRLRLVRGAAHMLGRLGDAGDQSPQLLDRVIDRVGDRAGHVLGDLRAHREIAARQIADIVQEPHDRVLVVAVPMLALLGTPTAVADVRLADQQEHHERQERAYRQRDEVDSTLGEQLIVAARELLGGAKQRLAVVEHVAGGALGVHQALHVAEDPAHRHLVFLEACLELAELRTELRIRHARDAHRFVPLQQTLQEVAERVAVLAEQERHLRVDHVAREHRVGILRHALREHHELRRNRVLAGRRTALHAERRHLVGDLEQRGIVVVDRAHRRAERDQVRLLTDDEP